jgi:hypothetical protein
MLTAPASQRGLLLSGDGSTHGLFKNTYCIYQYCEKMLAKHSEYIVEYLQNTPELAEWKLSD